MWTKEQIEAINKEGNLLVSAAAGAGKTAVMTERIVRIIAEGTKVEELLVVTYTKPAAAEMKQRIEKRLSELCDEEKDSEKKKLLTVAAGSISRANISTIHSFCSAVLKRNYHRLGIDPAFRIGDDAETQLLRNEALEEAMEEFYIEAEKNRDPASEFIKYVLDGNDGLSALITSVYNFIIARPDPKRWLEKAVENYGEGFDEASKIAGGFIIREARRALGAAGRLCEKAYNEFFPILQGKETGYLNILSEDKQLIDTLCAMESYEKWQRVLENYKKPVLKVGNMKAPDGLKIYRKQYSAVVDEVKKNFAFSIETEKKAAEAFRPVLEKLSAIVLDFMDRYAEKKQQEALVDYSDLEQMALTALGYEDAAEEFKRKFKYIFVDEYQDTNLVQDRIIAKISRGDNLFMVGDVKQSIYRFRQAEPASFLEKYRKYDGSIGTRIDLNNNFRSCTAILNAANTLFSKLMLGEVGEIDYSDNAALRPGENRTSGKVELVLIERTEQSYREAVGEGEAADDDDDGDGAFDELNSVEAEAAFIADKIRELMKEGSVIDKQTGSERKPVFSDFAVLMRKTRVPALQLINVLNERGIPCSAELGDGYFDALEVQIFINLLRVIDNARQDIPLVSVLRSPMFGFTDAELVAVRTNYDGESYIDRLKAAAADPDGDESACEKAAYFIKKLNEWRELAGLVTVETLIGKLFDDTRFYIYTSALPGGAVRTANLDLLLDKARAFASSGRRGVHAFISLMDSVRDNTNLGAAQAASIDAVRVMSIHKSKGLEFPIVFVCGLTGKFSTANSRSAALTDTELGIGLRANRGFGILPEAEEIPPAALKNPLFRRAIEAKDKSKQSAEEMRVLYVAMTRAREQLYLVGAAKKMASLVFKSAAALTENSIMFATGYLDWILGAYFPFGLNLQNASQGVISPIGEGEDLLTTRYILAEAAEGSDVRIKKAAFERWRAAAEKAEHGAADSLLGFVYPFEEDTKIPAKTSVTAVSDAEAEYIPAVPAFIRSEEGHKIGAAERGTATHRFIQLLPKEEADGERLSELLSEFTEKNLLSLEEAKGVYLPAVEKLVSSKLYRRMISSDFVRKEQEFSLLDDRGALIQGIIDCFFIEKGKIILIDYKTTALRGSTPEEIAEGYRPQLRNYALALERLTGLPVGEKWIYLLSAGCAVKL